MKYLLAILMILFCLLGYSSSCLDNQGNPVSWWMIIKKPDLQNTDQPHAIYIDSRTDSNYQYIKDIHDPNNALLQTIQSIGTINTPEILNNQKKACADYGNCSLLYSDQTPTQTVGSKYSHSKGIISFNENKGIWILHSLPKFPYIDANKIISDFSKNSNINDNGQMFFCLTINKSKQFKKIIKHLQKIKVNFYPNLPNEFYPKNKKGTSDKMLKTKINIKSVTYDANDQTQFTSYGRKYLKPNNNDIYEYYAKLKSIVLKVRHWFTSKAKELKENNNIKYIREMHFPSLLSSWGETQDDHSKWALSESGNHICVGDLNRENAQKERGGQILCFENARLWNILNSMITPINGLKSKAIKIVCNHPGISRTKLLQEIKNKTNIIDELISENKLNANQSKNKRGIVYYVSDTICGSIRN
ncbi:deoxyribonuclease II family protein [Francisella sp. TX07-6608]|uniref:deoxyribonuclease II family protein n=1 Tax=Francisella sp. TX07-6608 TaxID=573568 RepID=UPI0008F99D59|nr:deoxyribonuclease II family protein [Francisella sp. TX07-6608]OIN82985.1 deoxyribonuclease II family protein [Francisella sp. TX07-6608]